MTRTIQLPDVQIQVEATVNGVPLTFLVRMSDLSEGLVDTLRGEVTESLQSLDPEVLLLLVDERRYHPEMRAALMEV